MLRASHLSPPLFQHLCSASIVAAAQPHLLSLYSPWDPAPPQPLSHNPLAGVLSQVCKRHGNIYLPKLNYIQVIFDKLVIKYYGAEDNFHYLLIQFLLMFLSFYSSGYTDYKLINLFTVGYPKQLETCWLACPISSVWFTHMRYIYPSTPLISQL